MFHEKLHEKFDLDRVFHEKLQCCYHIVEKHQQFQPVPKEFMQYIGCNLSGRPCAHTGKPMYDCIVRDFPEDIPQELQDFVKDGVWSAPCVHCGSWLFFR